MFASTSRAGLRSARTIRIARPNVRKTNFRFASDAAGPAKPAEAASSSHLFAGLAGGSLVALGGYAWYHFSGVKTFVNTAHQTKSYIDQAFKKSSEKVPEPNQAIQWLRETVSGYAKVIPGAQQYVDTAFDDIDKVREKHGKEVDSIIKDTYSELKDITKGGASVAAAYSAWDVLQKCFKKISSVAANAGGDILENHPELKDKVGGGFTQLKQMGEQYGPEAKKQVDETIDQVKDIMKSGISTDTIGKVQKLIQEKTEQVKKYGDEAWQKGIEQAQPLLDKQPKLKELINSNKDKLMKGDLGQLWKQVQEATKSGNTDDLQKFVKEQTEKASSKVGGSGGGIDQLMKMIPGGSEVLPKLQQLSELSEKHGKEAEKLVKSAFDDIKAVLAKKVEEGQKLKEKAEKDASK